MRIPRSLMTALPTMSVSEGVGLRDLRHLSLFSAWPLCQPCDLGHISYRSTIRIDPLFLPCGANVMFERDSRANTWG